MYLNHWLLGRICGLDSPFSLVAGETRGTLNNKAYWWVELFGVGPAPSTFHPSGPCAPLVPRCAWVSPNG